MAEPGEQRMPIPAVADVLADDRGLGPVEDNEVTPLWILERLRGRRAVFLVLHLAVNDRGESVLRVADDVLPDVEHRSTGGIDERAAALDQARHVGDGDAERRQDHDVARAERVPAFTRIAQEADP